MDLYADEDPFAYGYGNGYGLVGDVDALVNVLKSHDENNSSPVTGRVSPKIGVRNTTTSPNAAVGKAPVSALPIPSASGGNGSSWDVQMGYSGWFSTTGTQVENTSAGMNGYVKTPEVKPTPRVTGSALPPPRQPHPNVAPPTSRPDAVVNGRRVTVRNLTDVSGSKQQEQRQQQQTPMPPHPPIRRQSDEETRRRISQSQERGVFPTTHNASAPVVPVVPKQELPWFTATSTTHPIVPTVRRTSRPVNQVMPTVSRAEKTVDEYPGCTKTAAKERWWLDQLHKPKDVEVPIVANTSKNNTAGQVKPLGTLPQNPRVPANTGANTTISVTKTATNVTRVRNPHMRGANNETPQGRQKSTADASVVQFNSSLWGCVMDPREGTPIARSEPVSSQPTFKGSNVKGSGMRREEGPTRNPTGAPVEMTPQEQNSWSPQKRQALRKAWEATPLLLLSDRYQMILRKHAAAAQKNRPKPNYVFVESAGEQKEIDRQQHSVLDQLVFLDRPPQQFYPMRMPLDVEKNVRKRRPRTPRSFYGKKGERMGADWFRNALVNAQRVQSPDLRMLEAAEANEKKNHRGRGQ